MPAPMPSLESAARLALNFTAKYPIVTVRLYQARQAGTPQMLAYEPFIGGMEPEQGKHGVLFTLVGSIKAGKVIG